MGEYVCEQFGKLWWECIGAVCEDEEVVTRDESLEKERCSEMCPEKHTRGFDRGGVDDVGFLFTVDLAAECLERRLLVEGCGDVRVYIVLCPVVYEQSRPILEG